MKLTTLLITIACLHTSAAGISQTITFKGKEVSIDKVFEAIQQQSDYSFFYDYSILRDASPVTIDVKGMTVKEVLDICFKGQPLSYVIKDRIIVVARKKDNSFAVMEVPPVDIKGRILSEKGEPLIATITVRGTSKGTTSNENGEFELKGIEPNAVLIISSVSFERQEFRLNNQAEVTIRLKVASDALDSASVIYNTGYQFVGKERSTGSFAQVDNQLINRSVSTNILDRIIGVTSGVNFEPRNGNNTTKSAFSVRGISTINANPRPLIVVDGFPYDEGKLSINNINPNDIESITVLKDAAAASIWGVQAGNGVIVVTTKKGKYGQKMKVQFNNFISIGEKPDLSYLSLVSSSEFIDLEKSLFEKGYYNGAIANNSTMPVLSEVVEILVKKRNNQITEAESEKLLNELKKENVLNDINKYLLQRSTNQQYALNISGGSEKFNYYNSIGYDQNKSNGVRDGYKRLTIRLDNTFRPVRQLEINAYVVYVESRTNANSLPYLTFLPGSGAKIAPYAQLADADGKTLAIPWRYRSAYIDTASFPALLDWHYRPLDELDNNDNSAKLHEMRIGSSIKYRIIPGIQAEVKYQYQRIISSEENYYNENSWLVRDLVNKYKYRNNGLDTLPVPHAAILDFTSSARTFWNIRGQITGNKKWQTHEISAVLGVEAREVNADLNRNRKYGYDRELNIFQTKIDYNRNFQQRPSGYGSSAIPNNDLLQGSVNRYRSYFGNAAYTFKEKYTATLSGRIDQSNFFGLKANQRFVPLWSAGLAWNIDQEHLYKINWLPLLKMRATFGFSGNTDNSASAFTTVKYTAPSSSSIINAFTASVVSPPNPELRWEKVKMVNMGIDFGLRGGWLYGSIEYYLKYGLNLISQVSVNPTMGVSAFTANSASIKGNGIDITLNSTNINRNQFRWNTNFLFSYNTDKVTSYEAIPLVARLVDGTKTPYIGFPLYSIYSYRSAGLDPLNGDPRGYVSDTIAAYNVVLTGNNTKAEDLIYNGSAAPQVFGSLRNTFSWRKVSLSFNILYKFNYVFRRQSVNYMNLLEYWGGNGDYSLRWQKPGDELITNVPSFTLSPNASRENFYQYSDVLVEKGDHIRLQDIRIGYDIRSEEQSRSSRWQAHIFIYANNLGVFWKATKLDIDPDFGNNSIPTSRTISLGINLTF